MTKLVFFDVDDKRVYCEFISSGGPNNIIDYEIGRAGSLATARVSIRQEVEASVRGSIVAGLTDEQCVAAVNEFRRMSHEEYLKWHEANFERLQLGAPEPARPEVKLKEKP